MSIPDNLIIDWYNNGKVRDITEVNSNNIQDGLYVEWFITGQIRSICNFKNGKYHGRVQSWNNNGMPIIDAEYEDGRYNGLRTWWYESGALWEKCNFVKGRRCGLCRTWADLGKKLPSIYYHNDRDVTYIVAGIVDDIENITEKEHTLLLIQYGYGY